MAQLLDDLEPRAALVEIGRDFHARGWMAGTAGNLSVRADEGGFWVTASGNPKGRLETTDFLRVAVANGDILQRFDAAHRPSAETVIHRAIYELFPAARACLHVHTVDACLSAEAVAGTELPLPPLEMLKGFGLWEQHPEVALPLFDNHLEVAAIAEAIRRRFTTSPPDVPALMIRRHGVTVWGGSLQEAYNRIEIAEFIMTYLASGGR